MKTCILLSTYNGERFVKEQIDSLVQQTSPPDYILVRDDGSSDRTLDIIKECTSGSKITLEILQGNNIGPARSFVELFDLGLATDATIFFFCDQDDIWEREKIAQFVERFDKPDATPQTVFSQLLLVDAVNKPIAETTPPARIGFGNSMIENVMTGCALACNRSLIKLLSERKLENPPMHDHLIYITSTLFGKIYYIENPLTRYRQHGSNVLGYSTSTWRSFKGKLRRIMLGKNYKKSELAQNILLAYGDIIPEQERRTLELIAQCRSSRMARLRLAASSRLWRQKKFHGATWRTLCLLGFF